MDTAGHVLFTANTLYARANSTATDKDANTATRPAIYKVIGIILAVCSGLFIGTSFVLKKTGLLRANAKYNEAAGEGYGYLKNAYWWTGMTLMIVGEICNFVAYAFVDAILVTPLGALSVVITTILSAIFLKERLSFVGKIGCFNCIIGSVVIVVNAPAEASAATIEEMQKFVISPGFLSYAGVVILGCLFVALWAGPRYGKKSMLVYLTICSMIGGLSVVATQGLGAAIVTQIGGTPQFNHWFIYVLLAFVIATLLTEIVYLNKALNLFNAALVTPTYYVYFTSATIVTSAILFRGFKGSPASIATVVMGFLQICAGVVLLQLAKSSKDVPDAAVFKGDLDQVRTIAEQEEPESEPRADTIRGGASLLRALSTSRTKRQIEEVKTIHHDMMDPIAEDEQVQWDGLRRRKTVGGPGQRSLTRSKTIHPPLGMSHFPDDTVSEAGSEGDIHPGFLPRFGRRSMRKSTLSTGTVRHASPSPVGLHTIPKDDSPHRGPQQHVYGLPPGLSSTHDGAFDKTVDTSYKSPGISAIHWDSEVDERERASSRGSSTLHPPRPPPHIQSSHRTFSFQNPFHRTKSPVSDDDHERPVSRALSGTLSFASRKHTPLSGGAGSGGVARATEEERAGLVTGDSPAGGGRGLPRYVEEEEDEDEDDDGDESDWQLASGRSAGSESPEHVIVVGGDLGYGRVGQGRLAQHLDEFDERDGDDLYGPPQRRL